MKVDLYFAAGSCAFAALIALEESGLSYEPRRLDLAAGQQRSHEFLAINPRGRVPTLVIDGEPIAENIAVLTTIAHLSPAARLLPFGDPLALGRAYSLMSWFASGIHVTIAQLWRSERFTADPLGQQALRAAAPGRLQEAFDELESRITGAWLLGSEFSVVDGYAGVFHRWASGRLGMDMARYPKWNGFMDRLMARPTVHRALAKEGETPLLEVA